MNLLGVDAGVCEDFIGLFQGGDALGMGGHLAFEDLPGAGKTLGVIGIGMSWLAIVASEMLLGGVGVGFFIWDQYNSSRISDIVVALLWVGLTGYLLDRMVALLGRLISRGSAT